MSVTDAINEFETAIANCKGTGKPGPCARLMKGIKEMFGLGESPKAYVQRLALERSNKSLAAAKEEHAHKMKLHKIRMAKTPAELEEAVKEAKKST